MDYLNRIRELNKEAQDILVAMKDQMPLEEWQALKDQQDKLVLSDDLQSNQ